MKRESRSMGRKCTLIDSAQLTEDVFIVVYQVFPSDLRNDFEDRVDHGFFHHIRSATYYKDTQMSSTIVRTWFSDSEDGY